MAGKENAAKIESIAMKDKLADSVAMVIISIFIRRLPQRPPASGQDLGIESLVMRMPAGPLHPTYAPLN